MVYYPSMPPCASATRARHGDTPTLGPRQAAARQHLGSTRAARRGPILAVAALVSAAWTAGAVRAQTEWRDQSAVARHAMAYDSAAQQLVRFGGENTERDRRGDTWVATPGQPWRKLEPATAPPARMDHSLVYADHLGAALMFGGLGPAGALGDLWSWDGVDWSAVPTAGGPTARSGHAAAYDPVRRVIVLFGGRLSSGSLTNETWEFDGTFWSQHATSVSPPPSWLPGAMAFNPMTQRLTLYPGGPDVWEWDGTRWTFQRPPNTPTFGVFVGHKLVTDPAGQGVVLIGGEDGSLGVWTAGSFGLWDGSRWNTLPAPPSIATERYHLGVASDGANIVAHGGVRREEFGFYRTQATYYWDGTVWSSQSGAPEGADNANLVFDAARGELLLLGGSRGFFAQTNQWARRGRVWAQIPAGPSAYGIGLAFDSDRDVVVAFGGCTLNFGGPCVNDTQSTWEWNGFQWSERHPATVPPARDSAAMAYDPRMQRTVMFGGLQNGAALTDTWTWDGTDWTALTPANLPPTAGPMTFDPQRGQLVLATPGELWTYDSAANDWALASSAPGLHPRVLTHDARRRRLVLMDRFVGTWEWIGGQWQQRQPRAPGAGGAYDDSTGAIVTFGAGGPWEYGPTRSAQATAFGSGCAGSQGTPQLRSDHGPWLGETWELGLAAQASPGPAFGCIGFDDQQWNGMPLPLDLRPFGMPGCNALIDIARADPLSGPSWVLAIPPLSSLLGCSVFAQALVIDPSANAAGAVVSNGVVGLVGGG